MRQYEIVVIVHPELDETALEDVVTRIREWITDDGGEISNIEMWGKKKLAYPIKKQNEGQYALLQVTMAPTFCSQLERNLRFLEPVIRSLLVSI